MAKKPSGTNCAFSELGVATCPCDGSVSESDYAEIVSLVRRGMTTNPALLLDRLEERMQQLSDQQRFEDAARLRDRHRALARAADRRRAWRTLTGAGTVWAQSDSGEGAVIDSGRLAAAWIGIEHPLVAAGDARSSDVPPTVEVAEEAGLIWSWLTGGGVRLVDATHPLAMPAFAVPAL